MYKPNKKQQRQIAAMFEFFAWYCTRELAKAILEKFLEDMRKNFAKVVDNVHQLV